MLSRMLLIVAGAMCFAACRSTDPTQPIIAPPGTSPGVYVINEGGFSGGGGVAFYDEEADTVYDDAVRGAGDWVFPNDMAVIGGKGYVAVNGMDRIDVVDLAAQAVVKSISFPAWTGPGFLAAQGETLCVANYDGSVSFIDLRTDSLVATTGTVVGFPGGIAVSAGKVFISDVGAWPDTGRWVRVLRLHDPAWRDSIRVENAPGTLVEQSGALFLACTGTNRVYRINPITLVVEDSVQLTMPLRDCSADGVHLYVLGPDSVAKLEDNPLSIISSGHIRRIAGNYFYALAAAKPSGNLYVSTIMSAGGAGRVESYRADGSELRPPFPVGVFPGAFAFRR